MRRAPAPSPEDLAAAQVIWDYMFVRGIPKSADVIIGLGSHDLSVADDAAYLYHQGSAPIIVFSGGTGRLTEGVFKDTEAQLMKRRALKRGVPEGVILVEEASTNTGDNIRFTYKMLSGRGLPIRSVILVHKPYMLRRDLATFKKQWPDERTDVTCWAGEVSMPDYLSRGLLAPRETIAIMVGDLQRVIEYPKLGFQIDQSVPATVVQAYNELVERGYTSQLIKPN